MREKQIKINKIAVIMTLLVIAAPSWATLLDLTEDGLGLDTGNLGTIFVIDEFVQISALTRIRTTFDDSCTGTVYLNRNKGLGVRTHWARGSKGISGEGPDQDEALVFDFTAEVLATSVSVGLAWYEENEDDPIISLILSCGDQFSFSEGHQNWSNAVTSLEANKVVVNVGLLLMGEGINQNQTLSGLYVRESSDHLYVNSLEYQGIPEPATVALLGLGSLILICRRRNQRQY